MRGPIMGVYPCNKALALVMFLNNDVGGGGEGGLNQPLSQIAPLQTTQLHHHLV